MSKEVSLILAISIILVLLIIFVVTFILYKKTPVPKGCENIRINEENCSTCNNKECSFYKGEGEE